MMLKIKGLQKSYEKKEVLRGIDFVFEPNKIYGLLGRNGSGKTTFFNCLNDDIGLDDGSFGLDDGTQLRDINSNDIGYVLSTPVVPEFLTAREFLKFFIEINQKHMQIALSIDDYLEMMRIEAEDRDRLLKDYSHGMKNKMQMLVNIMANPAILLLDEPLTSFDVVVADEMKQLLRNFKQGRIIILSTHIMELAIDLCDEIVILNHGLLRAIPRDTTDMEAYKQQIITALREE